MNRDTLPPNLEQFKPLKRNKNALNKWIRELTQDDDFSVEISKGDGNCFYYSVINALDKQYTVKQLRDIVITNITEDVYNDFNIFAKAGEPQYLYIINRELDTYDKFRKFMRTKDYFADEISIEILQKDLNLRFIIINKRTNNIQRMIDHDKKTNKDTKYIILEYEDDIHYNLITYDGKKVFSRSKIPKPILDLYKKGEPVKNIVELIRDKYLGQRLLFYTNGKYVECVVTDYNPNNWFNKFEVYNKTTKERFWVSESFIKKHKEPWWHLPKYIEINIYETIKKKYGE